MTAIGAGAAGLGTVAGATPLLRVCDGAAACRYAQRRQNSYTSTATSALVEFTCGASGVATVMTGRKSSGSINTRYTIVPEAASIVAGALVRDPHRVVAMDPDVALYRAVIVSAPPGAPNLPAANGTVCDSGPARGYLASLTTGAWGTRTSPTTWTDWAFFTAGAGRMTLTCTNGAIFKCDRHLEPWRDPRAEDRRNACVRMVRADYCGDGMPHTTDGVKVELEWGAWDEANLIDPASRFEGLWTASGTTCVSAATVDQLLTSGERTGGASLLEVHCNPIPFAGPRYLQTCPLSLAPAEHAVWNFIRE